MKTFNQYIKLREAGMDISPDGGNLDQEFIGDQARSLKPLQQITRLAWKRYQPDMQRFVNELAERDEDIKELVQQLDDYDPSANDGPARHHRPPKDDVVPSSADSNGGSDDGDVASG